LTREQEVELGKSIESAAHALLAAVDRSPRAVNELRSIVAELRDDTPIDELPVVPFDGSDKDDGVEAVTLAADEVGRADPSRSQHGLSRPAVERLVERLERARESARGAEQRALVSTLSEIRRQRDVAERATATFVEANIGLVIWMANKRGQTRMSLGDLIQEGSLGLIRAVEKFDHRRGIRFTTYAAWWIRHFMNRALSDQSRTIRLPVHLVETRSKVTRSAREFRQEQGRDPTDNELSERTGVAVEKLRGVLSVPGEPVSIDAAIGPEGDTRIGDLIADPEAAQVLDDISERQVQHRLRELLCNLKPREQEVLRLRYGIDRPVGMTLSEVGERFSLSRERIRQIESDALAKLRKPAEEEGLDAHFLG
jgi:RNA polymerase primary sigma factor